MIPRVVTCEHATWAVPAGDFDRAVLQSHVGWDEGALPLAETLAAAWGAPLVAAGASRLWVDCNRSADHPDVVPTRAFGVEIPGNVGSDREARLRSWRAFRRQARDALRTAVAAHGRVVHVSVHSFDPSLSPTRTYAGGVLFDPARAWEAELAAALLEALRAAGLDARANAPYLGTDDGHTTALRGVWGPTVYAGLELEMSQGLDAGARARWARAVSGWSP